MVNENKSNIIFYGIVTVLSFVVAFLVVVPVASMVFSVSVHDVITILFDKEVVQSLLLTFECAFYATLIAILFGIPLAYVFAFKSFPLKRFVITLFDIPMIIPHTASGIALLFVFGSGYISQLFKSFNIPFIGSKTGIVMAMAFVSIPYFINAVQNGFSSIDRRLINVARTLGASQAQCFIHVILPLSVRAIVTGSLMMWGRGISEFGAVMVIAYHPMIAPVLLYDRYSAYGLEGARPIAAIIIVFCIVFFVVIRSALVYREKNAYTA